MATYNSLAAFASAMKKGASTASGGGVIAKSEAEARAKAIKWQGIVEQKLRQTMRGEGYMSGGPSVYGRTGAYPTHTQKGDVSSNGTDEVIATVGYTPYSAPSVLPGSGGANDITKLIETGYHVRKAVWFREIPYFGTRPGVPIRSKVVSALQGMAAADGVELSLG